ncbi:ABC transporter ATP-binding protein [Listeria innocua]|uniref:ABC transporter ATP-binding protein n=1 Tax=Listeria innocua TaxID=1642 RepID=UPI0012EF8D16|nr:ATP-binding cassette domain-containing protein [Listeria innocua]ECB9828924.1 ATP-binding cassette domain-containing protein [Listeria monocytogenes]MBC1910464.1 ATP-binding cassette domain-containing protein [Listeria innocua]MBC1925455.1 ATP-binding cassette domain-containing protein [Listeria innocua]MBC1928803.1 ATP-binding cassette domain-containing protein [Listeria innocua]
MKKIEIINLWKSTPEGFNLHIDNLNLESDVIYGLIGPNGAGKTTFLKCVCNLLIPDSGEINYVDELLQVRRQIDLNLIGTNFVFMDGLNGLSLEEIYLDQVMYHNLKVPLSLKELLNSVNLDVPNSITFGKMSLGMKQRFLLGITLMSNPEIILLDEPFNGLDPDGVQLFIDTLKSFAKNRIIIISSHGLADLETFIDSTIFIENGKLNEPIFIESVTNNMKGGLKKYYDTQRSK